MAKNHDNPYQSFLLRLWKDGDGDLRIMLEQITTPQERHYFSSLPDLYRFLEAVAGSRPDSADGEDPHS